MKLPQGFRFAASYAGIRTRRADDLALMVSDTPAAAAGVFTKNQVVAAPVTVSREALRQSKGHCRAIVVNAGNANCATPWMDRAARRTVSAAAKLVDAPVEQVLVCSTGVIGEPLDASRIEKALPGLYRDLSTEAFEDCAKAIMTTDTVPKTSHAELPARRGPIRIAGMAKGAGMIYPNMATMLSFVFTDAGLRPAELRRMLKRAVDRSFNCISVDADTSTNDTVFLLANGASGVRPEGRLLERFEKALGGVMQQLAIAIVRDGEGARKLVTIHVEGAANDRDARTIARAIANSPLVKTAIAGADPNWGRFLSAAGASSARFDPAQVDIAVNGTTVCRGGYRAKFSEEAVQKTMERGESALRFRIRGSGQGQARFWTCDFTEEYIRINAEYRT